MRALAVALVVILAVVAPPVDTGDKIQAPELVVVSDALHASPMFTEFFDSFDGAIKEWLSGESRATVKGKWKILISESYDGKLQPRGITMTIVRSAPPHWMMVSGELATDTPAAVLAKRIIRVIQTASASTPHKEDRQ